MTRATSGRIDVRALARKGLLLAASLILAFGLGEVSLRAMAGAPLRRVAPQVRYDPHPVRGFTLRPRQDAYTYAARVQVDSQGFRSNGSARNDDGQVRVFALGDSFTFGMGVNDEQTWPAQLETLLSGRSGRNVGVTNGGVISYGVFQELDLLQERLSFVKPDVVVHALYWNDYQSAHPPVPNSGSLLTPDGYFVWDQDAVASSLLRRLRQWIVGRSAFGAALWNAAASATGRTEDDVSAYALAHERLVAGVIDSTQWPPVVSFLERLKFLGDSAGFVPFVVILPVWDLVRSPDPTGHPYAQYVRGLLEGIGLPHLDAFAVWKASSPGRNAFLAQGRDAHLSAKGYSTLAQSLAEALLADSSVARRLRGP